MRTVQILEAAATLLGGLRNWGQERPARAGRHERAQDLLDLADELQAILVPVQPRVDFRRRLHGELILKAQQRPSEGQAPAALQRRRKGILLGAAALGSLASFAGLIVAYVLHNRNGRATRLASG